MDINCKGCGKPIKRKPSEIPPSGNCYCSSGCAYQSRKGVPRPNMSVPRPNRKTGINKECEVCGKEFYAQACHSEQKYCGRECKGIASRLPIKQCAVCQKDFKPLASRPEQPCCSKECGAVYRRHKAINVHPTGLMKPCAQCGKDFFVVKSQFETKRCCSPECRKQWDARRKTTHTCKICEQTFKWSPSRTKSGKYNVTYCSLACRDADPERREMLIAMNAKQQRLTPNKVERIGYALLDELQVEYKPQYLIANKFCVDAFIPSMGIVVQFDGDYWHGNPALFPSLDTRQQRRVKLDRSQDAYMQTCGYPVIRIWASDLEKHLEQVKTRLQPLLVPSSHNPSAQE